MKDTPQRLIVTPGEPSGIGAEILIDAIHNTASTLITIDDPDRLLSIAKAKGLVLDCAAIGAVEDADHLSDDTLAVLPITWAESPIPRRPSVANAPQIIDAIKTAALLAKNKQVKAIVTNPIQKSTLYSAGFSSPGHTEYLGQLDGEGTKPVMMLANAMLKTVPLTIHIPLSEIPAAITATEIERTARILNDALRCDFGYAEPRIVVAGLNPHAGEGGSLGHEEEQIIAPTLEKLQQEGINITGPFSADTLFHAERRQDYDAAIAMYHDQALIPVKTLDFFGGVNITLGLSYIRTSPDHGTALDQAARGTANPQSLIAAIAMAEIMASNRQKHRG
jgi:4-hydroxythreonine-4-phosphate dehydrogenase